MKRVDAVSTFVIAALAFALSYSKLTDLAARAGYTERMSHLWPLVVDGLAVVAAMAVLRLQGPRRFAWVLLISATVVSVIAAVMSAMFPHGPLPPLAAALVSVVPPLCLLVAPHLAVQLMRDANLRDMQVASAAVVEEVLIEAVTAPVVAEPAVPDGPDLTQEPAGLFAIPVATHERSHDSNRQAEARHMVNEQGMSCRAVAKHFDVSDTTVRRWIRNGSEVAPVAG